jgi:hypothetical protein
MTLRNRVFGYGVVDRDGNPWWSEDCVSQDRRTLQMEVVDDLNAEMYPGYPYRVVRLYFKSGERKEG